MQTLLIILTVIVSILLIIVVLIQKSKGGGLASNFSGGNQMMGVRRTNDFIEKTTWTLAIIILFLSVFSSIIGPATQSETEYNIPAGTEQTQSVNFPTGNQTSASTEAAATEQAPTEAN